MSEKWIGKPGGFGGNVVQSGSLRYAAEMFDDFKLMVPTDQTLALHSRRGNQIANVVGAEPEERHRRKYAAYRAKHRNWINRKPSCGRYNCYGHCFAARRTAIYPDQVVRQIQAEDAYRLIAASAAVAGDFAVYKDANGFVHAAQIVAIKEGDAAKGSLRAVTLLSKWDDTAGEDQHSLSDVPFNFESIEYWTERAL